MAQNPPSKLRVMVDANTLFSGCVWARFPYEVLRHAVLGDYQLVLSPQIIAEAREAIQDVAPTEEKRLDETLAAADYAEVPTPTQEAIDANLALVPRDPKDVHVALAAMQAGVDYLISLDKDLTAPHEPVHQHLNVLLPAKFLREQMGWSSAALEAIRKRTWDEITVTDEPSQPPDSS
jgi:predicted nucleic acid-binding protein